MVINTAKTNNVPLELFLGSNINNKSNITHIYFTYFLSDGISKESILFQISVCEYLLSLENDIIDYALYSSASRDEELSRLILEDLPLIIAAFIIIAIYLSLTLGKFNCIDARLWLALSILIVELFALMMGFGFGFMIGTKFNTICALIPFILFGVGVDDMIIIVDTFDHILDNQQFDIHNKQNDNKMKKLMGIALSQSGLSITLTSLSSTVAFIIGSLTNIPGISAFCTFSAFCFISDYLLQLFLFVPFLRYDQQRIINYGNFCICCIHQIPLNPTEKDDEEKEDEGDEEEEKTDRIVPITRRSTQKEETPILSLDSYYPNRYNPVETNIDESRISLKRMISMEISYDPEQDEFYAVSCLGKIFLNVMLAILSKNYLRIIIIITAFAICGFSIYGLLNVKTDINLTTLFPDDSFLLNYFDALDKLFPSKFISKTYFMIQNIDLYDDKERDKLYRYIHDINNMTDIGISNIDHWLTEYDYWLLGTMNTSINTLESKSQFYEYLIEFTNDEMHQKWKSEIIYQYIEANQNQKIIDYIKSMRISKLTFALLPLDRYYPFIDEYHNIANNNNLDSCIKNNNECLYFYDIFLILSDTSNDLIKYVLENVLFAVIGVIITLLIFVDLLTLLIVASTIIIINIDLFGWIYINDIIIDPIIYTTFVMSVGLTVDYVIHVTHSLLHLDKKDENNNNTTSSNEEWFDKKLKIALIEMGMSVIKGAWTTFIGCCVLAFSQSRAFRDFFIVLCGIILISMIHGLFFVPSIIGTCFVGIIRKYNHQ